MEYAKENAKCIQCEGNKELYASQCRHLDPICITCATKMAKDKTPCPTCHQVFTKIFRQYKLKPCPDGDTNKFLAKFPPKLSDSADFMGAEKQNADNKYFRKSDKRKWIMYREGAEDKRNKSKIATRPWILENVMDKKKYKGKAKPVDNKMYYMVQFDYKRMSEPLVVYPIKSWYEFETEIQYKTLTTEEAENIMKSRKKNEEGYAKWISNEKMKKDEMEDVDENDETRKQKQLKKEDDSDQDEEEKKSNPDENDLPKGEDWEHEEEFTDDDLSASSEASESEGVPSDMSDFENEKVTESGAEMKNILKKEKLGENDVHEEKAENNDASNSVNEKDCSDGKNKRKDREEQEMTEVKNSEKAKVEQRNKRKKTGEGKPQESEAHRPPVEQRNGKRKANEGKPRESEAHRPPIEERHGKRKANEGKPQEPEAHRAHKKAKAASEGKSQESGAQKKVNDKASFEKLAREFLQQGPRDDKEMKSFMSQHAKGMKQEDIVAVLKLVSKKDKTTGKFMLRR